MLSRGKMQRRRLTPWQKWNLASSQMYKCALCKSLLEPGWHADHRARLCDGGTNHMNNFQALCVRCHTIKTHSENIATKKRSAKNAVPSKNMTYTQHPEELAGYVQFCTQRVKGWRRFVCCFS